jgi:protein-arginine kinase
MNKWYEGGGIMDDIVISSRIRLARNLSGVPLPCKAYSFCRTGNF